MILRYISNAEEAACYNGQCREIVRIVHNLFTFTYYQVASSYQFVDKCSQFVFVNQTDELIHHLKHEVKRKLINGIGGSLYQQNGDTAINSICL